MPRPPYFAPKKYELLNELRYKVERFDAEYFRLIWTEDIELIDPLMTLMNQTLKSIEWLEKELGIHDDIQPSFSPAGKKRMDDAKRRRALEAAREDLHNRRLNEKRKESLNELRAELREKKKKPKKKRRPKADGGAPRSKRGLKNTGRKADVGERARKRNKAIDQHEHKSKLSKDSSPVRSTREDLARPERKSHDKSPPIHTQKFTSIRSGRRRKEKNEDAYFGKRKPYQHKKKED